MCLAPAQSEGQWLTTQTQGYFCLPLVCFLNNSSLPPSIPEQSGAGSLEPPVACRRNGSPKLAMTAWSISKRCSEGREPQIMACQFLFLSSSNPGLFLHLVKDRKGLVFCFLQASSSLPFAYRRLIGLSVMYNKPTCKWWQSDAY